MVVAGCVRCAGPVYEDTAYSELESVWQHLRVYSIYQWKDTSWIPPDPYRFSSPAALMMAIPDTINSKEHFTVYNISTFADQSAEAAATVTAVDNGTVTVDTLTDSTVCVKITGFAYESTASEFMELLPAMAPFPYLVIDLRGNTGGYIDQVQPIIDAFLPEGEPYIHAREREYDRDTRTARTVDHYWRTEKTAEYALVNKKVTVLMDRYSASASEILIVALKETSVNATLVGDSSYGKGIGQIEISRRNRPGMKITYLQLEGISKIGVYHKVRIGPDINLGAATDSPQALLAAVRVHEPTRTVLRKSRSATNDSRPVSTVVERFIEETE